MKRAQQSPPRRSTQAGRPLALLLVFAVAIIAGGMTFNVTTIALPKVIDERVGLALPLAMTGSLATAVFVFGAMTQLADRPARRSFQPAEHFCRAIGAAARRDLALRPSRPALPLLCGLALAMAAIYGQVVINDAMIARYVPAQYRAKAFSVRYFLGFTASGAAAPMIALLHAQGGFPSVLAVAALFGAIVFACAVLFKLVASARAPIAAPAE